MDHWDELRMFLAVAEGGTVRAAADALDVNHATVIRGISRLETKLNAKLFEKHASGYRLTEAGTDIVDLAAEMATASAQIEARVFGRDQDVSGPLRLTLPISFATDLLMPALADFMDTYPDIALEIIGSGAIANLGNREADIALRVVTGNAMPPGNLYGMKLCEFYTGYYGRTDRLSDARRSMHWLLGQGEAIPSGWQPERGIRMSATPIRFAEMRSQFEAARLGMGITLLPCFLGDAEPLLSRVPGGPVARVGDVWLLTQSETRQTRRVRLLCEHIRHAVQRCSDRLAGRVDSVADNDGSQGP